MPRYNKGRYHTPIEGIDYLEKDQEFLVSKKLGKLVKWRDTCGWVHGIIEAEKPGWYRIYVFNREVYGQRRAVKRQEIVIFC